MTPVTLKIEPQSRKVNQFKVLSKVTISENLKVIGNCRNYCVNKVWQIHIYIYRRTLTHIWVRELTVNLDGSLHPKAGGDIIMLTMLTISTQMMTFPSTCKCIKLTYIQIITLYNNTRQFNNEQKVVIISSGHKHIDYVCSITYLCVSWYMGHFLCSTNTAVFVNMCSV